MAKPKGETFAEITAKAKAASKTARAEAPKNDELTPRWQFQLVDLDGCGGEDKKWSWMHVTATELLEILGRLAELEKLKWPDIEGAAGAKTGSHFVESAKIDSKARRRLEARGLDDFDQLFSLRISGKKRIYGIRDRGTLQIMWWDPDHEIYPSTLKNT